jgi:adenine deaminase
MFHVEHFYFKIIIMKIKGSLIDIHRRLIYTAEIEISGEKIKAIRQVENAGTNFILPGLIDSHVHIESSMVTPSAFAAEAVRHGTIGVVSDPHEIANVMGAEGVNFMIDDGRKVPLYFWFGAPSCVPATGFETSGGVINSEGVKELLERKEIWYLSEMMNFPGVIEGDREVARKIEICKRIGKPVDGHAPGLSGDGLERYIKAGISTDHECSTLEEALEKIGLGMKILIREGSAARNLEALSGLLASHPGEVMLCSDDLHPEMLVRGHINRQVTYLLERGYNLYDVLRSCTINPVNHYGLDSGLLREGDNADFIVTDDYRQMNIAETWIKGKKVFDREGAAFRFEAAKPVNRFNCSPVTEDMIRIVNTGRRYRVIRAFDGDLFTGEEISRPAEGEYITSDIGDDILKIVVKDRYFDATPAAAFIRGFGLRRGAFASSVAHDSHNIICLGTSDEDIVSCINEVVKLKGGIAATSDGQTMSMQLPAGGIMSSLSCSETAEIYERLNTLVKSWGCQLSAPFMTLSFMALLVIPELKVSDRGLFDVRSFSFTELFID